MQRYEITGMSCAACASHVEKAVSAVPGVAGVAVSLLTNSMQVDYTPEQLVGRMAYALGLQDTPAPRTPTELLNGFDWNKIPRQDIALPEGLF